jgi:hypothetical protein
MAEDGSPAGQYTEVEDDDSRFIFLEEEEGWALWVPREGDEAVVVHAHLDENDGAEMLFYECEPATGPDGEALARCPECGVTILEDDLDEMLDALGGDEDEDEGPARP